MCAFTWIQPNLTLSLSLSFLFSFVCPARRISAISIAERVAQEQCLLSSPPQQNNNKSAPGVGSLVGYQVRLESASSRDTQLLFLTPGVLLRKMQSSPMLSEYTHVVIDEVHERDKYTGASTRSRIVFIRDCLSHYLFSRILADSLARFVAAASRLATSSHECYNSS